MASDLPIYNIFVPQKVSLPKISDNVIACKLWFAPAQSKILAPPMVIATINFYVRRACIIIKIYSKDNAFLRHRMTINWEKGGQLNSHTKE